MRSEDEIKRMIQAHQAALEECPDGNTILEDTIHTLWWVLGKRDGHFHESIKPHLKGKVRANG